MNVHMIKTFGKLKAGTDAKVPAKAGRMLVKAGIARELPEDSAPAVVAPGPEPVAAQTYQTRHLQAAEPTTHSAPTKAVRKAPAKRAPARSTDTPQD